MFSSPQSQKDGHKLAHKQTSLHKTVDLDMLVCGLKPAGELLFGQPQFIFLMMYR